MSAEEQPTHAEPTDAEPTDAEPTDAEPTDAEPVEAPDRPSADLPERDGLDLARALTRATAGSQVAPAKRPPSAGPKRRRRTEGTRVSGSHPDERDPQTLDATLGRLVAEHGWELDLRVHGVFGRWPHIVGAEVAQHSTPESFADGRLVVRTDSTAWATQLTLLAPQLVRRLNEELGHGTVVAIDVQGPQAPSWKRGPRSIRGARGPRDTYG